VRGSWCPFVVDHMKCYEKFSKGKGQKIAPGGKRIPFILSIFLLLIASPVSPKEAFDMVLNSEIYPYPPYSFKTHFGHSLQIKVIEDNRPHYERISKSRSSAYIGKSSWSEPIAIMVEKVLEREFLLSNLFDSVSRHDERSSLLLEVDLNSFSAAWIAGRSGLKPIFTIYGAVDLNASLISKREEKILLIKNYRGGTEAEITQFRNKEGHAAIEVGKALKRVMVNLIEDIKSRLESLEAEPVEVRKGPTPIKKRPPKKQGAIKQQPPRKEQTVNKPKKPAIPQKDPGQIVLEPIGPK
jgi:ABC-type uncharacterized transport system auxiliary subunit